MKITANYREKGNEVTTGPLHYVTIKAEGVSPDGSWDTGSTSICTIEMTGPDGKAARFFVSVGLSANGQPYGNITGLKANTDTRKTVFASWLDFAKRAAARIG